ncbi:hypothetical protein [Lentzea sp. CC55]|uniref:hypothetical protein n=1 Tax=Lentzea sp. CC55 TaxID=2884909 RepID=UPI001F298088|nr:hypothetical protein [Lentzea sp. CC55]MCG8926621.1 hypothetical protein [Lentzea sp. CC55]
MQYEDALKAWGARRIERANTRYEVVISPETVSVDMDFSEGVQCCPPGQRDSLCYCSQAESPRAQVQIWGQDENGGTWCTSIPAADFDFRAVLGEIVAEADGMIHNFG